ncbi:MAG: type I 3-dehydroquinate dehydratase [Candidatus Bipolaricaulota bacterium]
MRTVRVGSLLVGTRPVLVASSMAETVDQMLDGARQAVEAGADCVELRIDRLPDVDAVGRLVREMRAPHIVACRPPEFGGAFAGGESARIERLLAAVTAGATAVDVEVFTDPGLRDPLVDAAQRRGTPVLVGYENMKATPSLDEMIAGLRRVAELGPDLAKLAVRASSPDDLVALLCAAREAGRILGVPFAAVSLGPYGAASRPVALLLGSSFTYCATGGAAAPGQLTVGETRDVLRILSAERWSCSSN